MLPILKKAVDAHSRSQSTTIIRNPYSHTNQVITIGHDSYVRAWHASDLSVSKTLHIANPYLTSIVAYEGKFLIGIGSGKIVVVNPLFQIQKEYLVHDDCITGILLLQDYIVTCSYDCTIKFLQKHTLKIEKTVHLQSPIHQILATKTDIYTCSNPSYKISLDTLIPTSLAQSYIHLTLYKDNVFGCSHQHGLSCLSRQLDSDMEIQVNCDFLMAVEGGILFTSGRGVGVLEEKEEDGQKFWNWRMRAIEMEESCMTKSGVEMGSNAYLTGESGDLYKIGVQKG